MCECVYVFKLGGRKVVHIQCGKESECACARDRTGAYVSVASVSVPV